MRRVPRSPPPLSLIVIVPYRTFCITDTRDVVVPERNESTKLSDFFCLRSRIRSDDIECTRVLGRAGRMKNDHRPKATALKQHLKFWRSDRVNRNRRRYSEAVWIDVQLYISSGDGDVRRLSNAEVLQVEYGGFKKFYSAILISREISFT